MPKPYRGGKGASGAPVINNAQPAVDNTPPVIDTTQPTNNISPSYQAFLSMTDDDKADAISKAFGTDVPSFLSNSDFQKLTYALKLNDKPTLVDDKTLDQMAGVDLYRTVNATKDTINRMTFDATDIASQILKGSVTRVSDTGGSAYGRGLYFANSYRESTVYYGNTTGNIKQTAVVRGKLNANAKVISASQALSSARAEIASGSRLGNVLARADRHSQRSIWALAKGYNVMVDNSSGYYVVLNRTALTMSDQIKAKGSKW